MFTWAAFGIFYHVTLGLMEGNCMSWQDSSSNVPIG
jgi:hypothetical protein